jgi:hypothetical protein
MATLAQIRTGLAANLEAGLSGYQESPYFLLNPSPPAIQVVPGGITYDMAMRRGLDELELLVQAFVALTSDIGSQVKLDALLAPTGAGSLKTAAESDPTLGGIVSDVNVVDASGYTTAQGANGPILLCEWSVQILAQN